MCAKLGLSLTNRLTVFLELSAEEDVLTKEGNKWL
jgi:hypothetical protein